MKFEAACKYILNDLATGLSQHLTYHSVAHTKDVYQAAKRIGIAENINPHHLQLLLTAACYHDAGFLFGSKDHELESCRIATVALREYEYTEADIALVCGMIMATRIPQTPKNHLEEILADADLDYLGRTDFFEIGATLHQELNAQGKVMDELEWNLFQQKFMESHHYFTATAVQTRHTIKEENLKNIQAKIVHFT